MSLRLGKRKWRILPPFVRAILPDLCSVYCGKESPVCLFLPSTYSYEYVVELNCRISPFPPFPPSLSLVPFGFLNIGFSFFLCVCEGGERREGGREGERAAVGGVSPRSGGHGTCYSSQFLKAAVSYFGALTRRTENTHNKCLHSSIFLNFPDGEQPKQRPPPRRPRRRWRPRGKRGRRRRRSRLAGEEKTHNWINLFHHYTTLSHLDPFLGRFRRLRRRPHPRRPLRRRRRRLLQTGEAREAREAQRRQRQQRRHPARHTDLPVEADEVTLTHLRSPPK